MTREEILAMPAGRELDALVAEHVMGWQRITERPSHWLPLTGRESYPGPWWALPDMPLDRVPENGICMPQWSASTAAAIEMLEATGMEYKILRVHLLCVGGVQYDVQLNPYGRVYDSIATAHTLPLAACRAALLAVME